MRKSAVAILVFTLFIQVGCSTSSIEADTYLSTEEKSLRDQHNTRRVVSAAFQGCATAALTAAVFTVAVGGNSEALLRNTAVSCAVGGAVGAAAGAYVNARANAAADQQAYYRSLVSAADADIERYGKLNAASTRLVAEQKQKIAQLNKQLENQEIDLNAYRQRVQSGSGNMQILRDNVREMNDNIETIQADLGLLNNNGVSDTSALRERQARLKGERDRLKALISELAGVYRDVPQDVGLEIS